MLGVKHSGESMTIYAIFVCHFLHGHPVACQAGAPGAYSSLAECRHEIIFYLTDSMKTKLDAKGRLLMGKDQSGSYYALCLEKHIETWNQP